MRIRPRHRVQLGRDLVHQAKVILAYLVEVEMRAAGQLIKVGLGSKSVETRLKPVRGAIQVKGVCRADNQVNPA